MRTVRIDDHSANAGEGDAAQRCPAIAANGDGDSRCSLVSQETCPGVLRSTFCGDQKAALGSSVRAGFLSALFLHMRRPPRSRRLYAFVFSSWSDLPPCCSPSPELADARAAAGHDVAISRHSSATSRARVIAGADVETRVAGRAYAGDIERRRRHLSRRGSGGRAASSLRVRRDGFAQQAVAARRASRSRSPEHRRCRSAACRTR